MSIYMQRSFITAILNHIEKDHFMRLFFLLKIVQMKLINFHDPKTKVREVKEGRNIEKNKIN